MQCARFALAEHKRLVEAILLDAGVHDYLERLCHGHVRIDVNRDRLCDLSKLAIGKKETPLCLRQYPEADGDPVGEIASCGDQSCRLPTPQLKFEFRELLGPLARGDRAVVEVDLHLALVTPDQPARAVHIAANDFLKPPSFASSEQLTDRVVGERFQIRPQGSHLTLDLFS